MKNSLILLFLLCSIYAHGQWCSKPNPNFCPGNFFQNGDFETITGNPNIQGSDDINLATGWQQIWQTGSFADLFCNPGISTGTAPTPITDVYAGMWIENRAKATTNAIYREGMYNRLANPIAANSGSYSINFRIANAQYGNSNPANPTRIGIYGVFNPSNTVANNPTNNHFPKNTDLWLPNLSVKVVLLGTVSTPGNFSNTWWTPPPIVFNSNMLPIGGITHIMVTTDDMFRPTTPGQLYVNFDEFCIRRADNKRFCCPSITGANSGNKIINGDFEGGNAGFTSGYIFDPALTTGSVTPGEYNIVNGSGAASLNSAWVAQDPSTCQNGNGMFLVANGSSGSTMKLVWKNTVSIPVNDWGKHKFCFQVKYLKTPPAAAQAKIEIRFPGSGVGSSFETIPLVSGACNWQTITKGVDLWGTTSTLNIEIWIDESVSGGNDLAFDNLALIEVPPCPASSTLFSIATTTLSTHYNITATATTIAPCPTTWWEVCEVDPSTLTCSGNKVSNPSSWWFPSHSFNTYNGMQPGKFEYGKLYKITRGTWGNCHGWNAFSMYVGSSLALKKINYYSEEEVNKNKGLVQEILK